MGDRFIKEWSIRGGNSSKRLEGEDPMPDKSNVATENSWKVLPFPEKNVTIPMDFELSEQSMNIVKRGHIPEQMEDHWFMYCDNDTIRYYRSWTGYCIFVAKYEKTDNGYLITELKVSRDPEQYKSDNNDSDKATFLGLLVDEYGGNAEEYWNEAFK